MIYTLVYSIINIYSNNIFSIPFGFLWRFFRCCCCCSCVGILCARKNTLCTCRVVHNISFRVINYGFVLLFIYFVLFSCPFVCVRLFYWRFGILLLWILLTNTKRLMKKKLLWNTKINPFNSIYCMFIFDCGVCCFGCFVHQFNCTIFSE